MSSRKAKDDVFCHCRGPEDGFMIECESCKEWFHGTCVGVENQTEANNFIHWSCFVCVRVNNAVTQTNGTNDSVPFRLRSGAEQRDRPGAALANIPRLTQ
ncbi:chromatin remodeling protein EBS-like [Thrips palmi]|uniref:Chromatin remodeling protein EBS-like n=1 Tax=Thrips palmi TaxID=161013 RepID=A0A6P8YEE3_THRPL|nr:chromatin remodeling protein EBS-like [Thrips palmi]